MGVTSVPAARALRRAISEGDAVVEYVSPQYRTRFGDTGCEADKRSAGTTPDIERGRPVRTAARTQARRTVTGQGPTVAGRQPPHCRSSMDYLTKHRHGGDQTDPSRFSCSPAPPGRKDHSERGENESEPSPPMNVAFLTYSQDSTQWGLQFASCLESDMYFSSVNGESRWSSLKNRRTAQTSRLSSILIAISPSSFSSNFTSVSKFSRM